MELAHDNSWAHNSSGTDAFYFLAGSLALASFFRQWIPLLSVVVVSAWSRLVLFPRLFVCLPLCLFAPLWCHSVRVFFWSVVWCVCAACCLSLVERANPCACALCAWCSTIFRLADRDVVCPSCPSVFVPSFAPLWCHLFRIPSVFLFSRVVCLRCVLCP